MTVFVQLRSLWRNLFQRAKVERALDDEINGFVEMLAKEYEQQGMTPVLARRRALMESGGITQLKEATRDVWMGNVFRLRVREIRYAFRSLSRTPAFLAIAILTLAIGIGGATAVFTVVNASLLRPLPAVAEPNRLVAIERAEKSGPIAEFNYPDFIDFRDRSKTLTGLAGFNGTSMELRASTKSARVWVSYVSDNFFTVLGVQPHAGRLFSASENGDALETVVLSYALWKSQFGGAENVIGSSVELDGHPFVVIGVAPPTFLGAMVKYPMDVFIPFAIHGRISPTLASGADLESRTDAPLRLIGRLASGRTAVDAERELSAIASLLSARYPSNSSSQSVLVFPRGGMSAEERSELTRVPRLLGVAVALLLMIACGNVACLSLVRASGRRREFATRVALGAARGALVRQVALEGVVLAIGAGLCGVVIAQLLVRSAALVTSIVPIANLDLRLNWAVLAIAVASSILTAVVVSILPALQVFRIPPGAVLKDGGGAVRQSGAKGQRALVSAQVAGSLMMLSASAIIAGAFQRVLLSHEALGPQSLTDAMPQVDHVFRDTTAAIAYYHELLRRVASEPTIESAAVTTTIPPFDWSSRVRVFRRGEEPSVAATATEVRNAGLRVSSTQVSSDFLGLMHLAVERGRGFTTSDNAQSEPVAIVSRRLADALWPSHDPIGQFFSAITPSSRQRTTVRVVGVVADAPNANLEGNAPFVMYMPFEQKYRSNMIVLVRSRLNTAVTPEFLQRVIANVNPNVPILGARTLQDRLENEMRPQQTAGVWIGVFSLIALLLAAIGLYGVVAQRVLLRTREIGVRSALGASPRSILQTIFGDGMRLTAIGAVAGVIGTIAILRILQSTFPAVRVADLDRIAVALVVLCVSMFFAILLPARRASKINVVDALKNG